MRLFRHYLWIIAITSIWNKITIYRENTAMKEQNIINTFKTVKDLEAYRTQINEMCDERKKFITLCEEADALSKKPFAYIKEAFEAISPELFKTNEGKKIMNKYTKLIRESKHLQSLHIVHENIRKTGKDTDIEFFVKSLTEATWCYNQKEVSSDLKKLGRVLAEGYLHLGETAKSLIPEEKANMPSLTKAVEFILENKKKAKNLAEYSDAVKVIKEHISNNDGVKNTFETVDLDNMAENLIREFNLKYSDKLTIEEANALKEISNSENRESVFNKYKEVCATKITEAKKNFEAKGDKASSDRLGVVLEQISSKSYVVDTIGTDICGFIELSNIFE